MKYFTSILVMLICASGMAQDTTYVNLAKFAPTTSFEEAVSWCDLQAEHTQIEFGTKLFQVSKAESGYQLRTVRFAYRLTIIDGQVYQVKTGAFSVIDRYFNSLEFLYQYIKDIDLMTA